MQMYLYPCLAGSFQRTLGIPDQWTNSVEKEQNYNNAVRYLCVFSFLGVMCASSIIQTIRTNPGNIPEDKEWDMLTDSMIESSEDDGESGFSSSDNQ